MGEQVWDPEQYARTAGFVPALGQDVLRMLDPRPHERVLDLGCGDGVLTERLAGLAREVVGVDASAAQVEAARARNLNVRVVDAQALDYSAEFDAVFSNAALHWMHDADAVIAGVFRALRPGGRFVAECGGFGCVAKIRQALERALAARSITAPMPWYFPSDREYAQRLERAGFEVQQIALFDRPTPLPGDITDWLETFAQIYLATVSQSERASLLNEVRKLLEPDLLRPNGWFADYVRLRFHATKP